MDNLLVNENQYPEQPPNRTGFLTALCVLSFIWSGLLILCLFIALCCSGFIFTTIESIMNGTLDTPGITEAQKASLGELLAHGQGTFVAIIAAVLIVYMTSLLGVVKMWKLQKSGFYIYAVVNGASLIYDVVMGSYFMAFISLLFIGLYALNLKHMGRKVVSVP